jgi:hypothetical protein
MAYQFDWVAVARDSSGRFQHLNGTITSPVYSPIIAQIIEAVQQAARDANLDPKSIDIKWITPLTRKEES